MAHSVKVLPLSLKVWAVDGYKVMAVCTNEITQLTVSL
jgi:hypothetical protein